MRRRHCAPSSGSVCQFGMNKNWASSAGSLLRPEDDEMESQYVEKVSGGKQRDGAGAGRGERGNRGNT